jgi:predicted flap endonuclease-1-like 5' DNA nuclease
MSYPISDIEGMDCATIDALKQNGIRTTEKLLERAKNTKGRKALARETGIDEHRLLSFANAADRMRIKGLGKDYAALLHAAGVDTVRELRYRNPRHLAQALSEANAQRKLVRQLPSDSQLNQWIANARSLPPKISY